MDDVAKLLAIEEIKQVKARYFRLMDQKEWDALPSVFAPDVTFDVGNALLDPSDPASADVPRPAPLAGRDTIVDYISTGLRHVRSVHHGHMAEIEIESDDRATAIFAMYDRLRFDSGPYRAIDGFGHYHETYRKIDGRWYIATIKLTRLQVEVVTA